MSASQLVTFGVGSPADVPNFLLWGLGGTADAEPATGPSQYIAFGIGSPASIPNWLLLGLGGAETPVDGVPTERLSLAFGSYVSRQAVAAGSATSVMARGYGAFQARQPTASGSVE